MPDHHSRVPEELITKEQVREWLKKAGLRELTIFHDKNAIIVLLCRALLNAWGHLDWKRDKKKI
jgi:hypothetical protein